MYLQGKYEQTENYMGTEAIVDVHNPTTAGKQDIVHSDHQIQQRDHSDQQIYDQKPTTLVRPKLEIPRKDNKVSIPSKLFVFYILRHKYHLYCYLYRILSTATL